MNTMINELKILWMEYMKLEKHICVDLDFT